MAPPPLHDLNVKKNSVWEYYTHVYVYLMLSTLFSPKVVKKLYIDCIFIKEKIDV